MKICLVAAPLIARSGVYNSAVELVTAARDAGHEWQAVLGVSTLAGGARREPPGVSEFAAEPNGIGGVVALSRLLMARPQVREADLVVTLVPQSDMAMSLTRKRWVAYLRGLPWPAAGEARRMKSVAWRALERAALQRANDVWATTPLLARETGRVVRRLVPPGIAEPPPLTDDKPRERFVWAARYSADKNPLLFADAMRGSGLPGVMFGTGPMVDRIRDYAPENVAVPGWAEPGEIWDTARAYVGTSSREAFGRSAVEAAMLGIPPIISSAFGCAEMLYTDPALSRLMVVDSTDPAQWRAVITAVASDSTLHRTAALHAQKNSRKLTVEASVDHLAAAASTASR